MSDNSNPDDAVLLAQLGTGSEHAAAWARLAAVADEFAACPRTEDDCRRQPTREEADGVFTLGYPVYGERVKRAYTALAEVGAVTPVYRWMDQPPPHVPKNAVLPPADAVRLATAIVRGERFCDGNIGAALDRGTFQAVLASLAAWYRSEPRG